MNKSDIEIYKRKPNNVDTSILKQPSVDEILQVHNVVKRLMGYILTKHS